MKGTITKYFDERHYGFLIGDDGTSLFFHELDAPLLPQPIVRSTRVEFEIGEFRGKNKATNVRPLSGGAL
jgi:cold shock CspA family protein